MPMGLLHFFLSSMLLTLCSNTLDKKLDKNEQSYDTVILQHYIWILCIHVCVVCASTDEHGKGFHVRLHTVPEEGSLRPGRFHVSNNNIRRKWFRGQKSADTEGNDVIIVPWAAVS